MKTKKLLVKSIIIVALCTSFLTQADPVVNIYAENHYDATVAFNINGQQEIRVDSTKDFKPVLLGSTDSIKSLSIRTTGTASNYLSRLTPLDDILKLINQEAAQHYNKDAILMINPSESYFSTTWNIKPIWRNKNTNVSTFEVESAMTTEEHFFTLPTMEARVKAILAGLFGSEVAKQTNDICSTNYANAVKLGKVNLCHNLQRNLVSPKFIVKKEKAAEGLTREKLALTIDEIKEMIALLHKSLRNYKDKGWVQ